MISSYCEKVATKTIARIKKYIRAQTNLKIGQAKVNLYSVQVCSYAAGRAPMMHRAAGTVCIMFVITDYLLGGGFPSLHLPCRYVLPLLVPHVWWLSSSHCPVFTVPFSPHSPLTPNGRSERTKAFATTFQSAFFLFVVSYPQTVLVHLRNVKLSRSSPDFIVICVIMTFQ